MDDFKDDHVDDDQDVHSTTTFALGNLQMEHRQLEFVHAYSSAKAREMLQYESEIAVILHDVVMEQPDAGLHLVRNLGLIVVAEGVEDQRQAQILQALGCPLAQGFLFARPMPAQELYSWLGNELHIGG